jgi:hypothetical protein
MQAQSRRGFLQWLAAGVMMLAGKSSWAQQVKPGAQKMIAVPDPEPIPLNDPLRRTLLRTTKANYVKTLASSKLSPEDKLAVAAAKELSQVELEAVTAKLHGSKDLGSSTGFICGGGCDGGGGDTGVICGANCKGLLGKAAQVVDPAGLLKLNMKDLNTAAALKSLDKVVAIGKQAAVR